MDGARDQPGPTFVGEIDPGPLAEDEEAVAEDEAALSASTVMDVPAELVPTVRELIAKHKKSA